MEHRPSVAVSRAEPTGPALGRTFPGNGRASVAPTRLCTPTTKAPRPQRTHRHWLTDEDLARHPDDQGYLDVATVATRWFNAATPSLGNAMSAAGLPLASSS